MSLVEYQRQARNQMRHGNRGIAIVEFVIVAPLLLFLLLAIAEVGRMMYQYALLADGVRNAVRFVAGEAISGSTGVVPLPLPGTLQTQGKNLAVYGSVGTGTPILPGLSTTQVTVNSNANGTVFVSAVYPYSPIIGSTLPTFGLGPPISLVVNLTATTTMQALP